MVGMICDISILFSEEFIFSIKKKPRKCVNCKYMLQGPLQNLELIYCTVVSKITGRENLQHNIIITVTKMTYHQTFASTDNLSLFNILTRMHIQTERKRISTLPTLLFCYIIDYKSEILFIYYGGDRIEKKQYCHGFYFYCYNIF